MKINWTITLSALCSIGIPTYLLVSPKLELLEASNQLDSAIQAYQAAGFPLGIPAEPKFAESEDATPQVEEAIAAMAPIDRKSLQQLNADSIEYSDLPPIAKSLGLVRLAAQKPHLARDSKARKFAILNEVATMGRILAVAAIEESRSGDSVTAAKDLALFEKMEDWLDQDQSYSGVLISGNNSVLGNIATRRCMALLAHSSRSLILLKARAPKFQPDPTRMLPAEARAMIEGVYYFEQDYLANINSTVNRASEVTFPQPPHTLESRAYLARVLQQFTYLMQHGKGRSILEFSAISRDDDAQAIHLRPSYAVVDMMHYEYDGLDEKLLFSQAHESMTRAYADILIYRNAHGYWPASLDDVGSYPDPFSGVSLRYQHHKDGFRVYSLGPDREDRGGRTIAEENAHPRIGMPNIVAVFPAQDNPNGRFGQARTDKR
jgi:hypothetical protein